MDRGCPGSQQLYLGRLNGGISVCRTSGVARSSLTSDGFWVNKMRAVRVIEIRDAFAGELYMLLLVRTSGDVGGSSCSIRG